MSTQDDVKLIRECIFAPKGKEALAALDRLAARVVEQEKEKENERLTFMLKTEMAAGADVRRLYENAQKRADYAEQCLNAFGAAALSAPAPAPRIEREFAMLRGFDSADLHEQLLPGCDRECSVTIQRDLMTAKHSPFCKAMKETK